jgi:hypothetical protein
VEDREVGCKDEMWMELFRILSIGGLRIAIPIIYCINLLASVSSDISDSTTTALLSHIEDINVR